MIIKDISELVWSFYQAESGSVKTESFLQLDIAQMIKLAVANEFRVQYYVSQQRNRFGEADYSFFSPLLSTQTFELPEANMIGLRRIDMGEVDLFRFPGNMHIPNVYPVGEGCGNQEVGEITQVKPAEENFYINDPDMATFQFYVVKGRGLNTYNIPHCIKELQVESTFLTDDIDISMDIAYAAAIAVLTPILKIGEVTGTFQEKLREKVMKQEVLK